VPVRPEVAGAVFELDLHPLLASARLDPRDAFRKRRLVVGSTTINMHSRVARIESVCATRVRVDDGQNPRSIIDVDFGLLYRRQFHLTV
jgi:hypothetical protein